MYLLRWCLFYISIINAQSSADYRVRRDVCVVYAYNLLYIQCCRHVGVYLCLYEQRRGVFVDCLTLDKKRGKKYASNVPASIKSFDIFYYFFIRPRVSLALRYNILSHLQATIKLLCRAREDSYPVGVFVLCVVRVYLLANRTRRAFRKINFTGQ